ncbi:recombinase family protein [Cryobacterium sp. Sr8]|uniref:recombinase family protein n=1 Tax=Cryobacterium sp. Sr8 TaxID=1259203 RepID=UPI00106B9146|nr:recombinase family protein [Cryobacterium sp. Sr8]TFD74104.1 recombinase family protein [Cryobacterium sp. Sr8]
MFVNMYSKVAIYARQSEDEEEGIARQLAICHREVERRGWTVAAEYTDNRTSATKSRGKNTQWARMLADIQAGRVDVVVAVDLDRLLRSLRDLLALLELKVPVVTVNGEIDLTTADGELRATMLAAIARFEVRRKSERQIRANASRIEQGKPIAGGRRRFGFEPGFVKLREAEAAWVLTIYQSIADGKSLRSIARSMNEAGVQCVTKGLWNAPRVYKIAVNPAYRGYVIHNGQASPSTYVPVVVPAKLAARVDEIMSNPARRKSPGSERSALMGGLGLCGTCGAPLISAGTKYRGEAIATYACSAVKGQQTQTKGHPSIRRAILDNRVRREVAKAFFFGAREMQRTPSVTGLGRIDGELGRLARDKADLLSSVGSDTGVTVADIRPQLTAIKRKSDILTSEREKLEAESAHARMAANVRSALMKPRVSFGDVNADLERYGEQFDALDLDTKRVLIEDLLEVKVQPGRGPSRVHIEHKVATSLNDDPSSE